MTVYLVPVSADRYELYFEASDADAGEDEPPRGWLRRWAAEIRELIRQAEPDRRRPATIESVPTSAIGRGMRRVRRLIVRWVAASIAEQRLLWHLRRQSASHVLHPDDLDGDAAMRVVRRSLQRDADRHLFWLVFDAIGLIVSGLFAIVPGPNLIAYYFAFRVFGHFLSRQGASQGLHRVAWQPIASEALRELRNVVSDGGPDRRHCIREVAQRLELERFAAFVERTARRSV